MAQKRNLVVDDDPDIRALLRRCLEADGFSLEEAEDGAGVARAFDGGAPDLVTLDLTLGCEDGLDIARAIRQRHDVPIMMVTGKDDVIDRVLGLELGADDYLTKPFHVRGALARVCAAAGGPRTTRPTTTPTRCPTRRAAARLCLDGLTLDLDRLEVIRTPISGLFAAIFLTRRRRTFCRA